MRIRQIIWLVCCSTLLLCACDDYDSSTLGMELVSDADMTTIGSADYDVEMNSILVDSVLARTSTCQLGNYTDPETGTIIHSDYLMQLNNSTGTTAFGDSVVGNQCTSVKMKLYFANFVGDSLAPCRVSLYPMKKVMDNSKSYYTNIDPTEYYDASSKPIASASFSISDRTLTDEDRYESTTKCIVIDMPKSIGNQMIKTFKEHPEYFASGKTFSEKVNPGYFVKFDRGEGVMMDIVGSQLLIGYDQMQDSQNGVLDSLSSESANFAGTEEVIQATSIKKYNMEKLLADQEATYVKSPSCLFTEVTLPIADINVNDTINSAKLIFDCLNAKEIKNVDYSLSAPTYLLMVEKSKMNEFFEKNKLADDERSYTATYSSTDNNYTFENIAHLVTNLRNDYIEGMAKDKNWAAKNPDWNKVVLVPVEPVFSSSSSSSSSSYYYYYYSSSSSSSTTIVALNHNLSMTNVRLKKNGVKLKLIYSKFKQY